MVCIVIPTFNEAQTISSLIREIFSQNIRDLYVVIVDDNSPDGTADIVRAEMKEYHTLHLIFRESKSGIGSAYRAGFSYAMDLGAEYVFEMDADFSHAPADLSRMLDMCRDNNDLVIGSRRISGGRILGWNLWRHATSAGATFLSRALLRLQTQDVTSGFRCYRSAVLRTLDYKNVQTNGYAFQEEMVYLFEKNHRRIKEIPVIFEDRKHGRSKLGMKDVYEFFITLISLKRDKRFHKKKVPRE